MEKKLDHYIIAAVGKWNKQIFDLNKNLLPGKWHLAQDKKGLEKLIKRNSPKIIFFLHWRWYVSQKILTKNLCICFHMTDLPYGRGGSPLQNLILKKHEHTYLTCFKMTEEYDSGPYYLKRKLSLKGSAQQIFIRSSKLSWRMIQSFIKSHPSEIEQKGKPVYFKRRKPSESKIKKNFTVKELYDFIRMLDADGYPNAFIEFGSNRIYLKDAKFKNGNLIFNGFVKNYVK